MASIFTKIINQEIPCEKIFESESEIAFLDIAPWTYGHTLVVPKTEVARLEDLEPQQAQSLMVSLQTVARAVSQSLGGVDYNVLLNNGEDAGQEVLHVHFHIIPRPRMEPFSYSVRKRYQEGEMQEYGAKIRAKLP